MKEATFTYQEQSKSKTKKPEKSSLTPKYDKNDSDNIFGQSVKVPSQKEEPEEHIIEIRQD